MAFWKDSLGKPGKPAHIAYKGTEATFIPETPPEPPSIAKWKIIREIVKDILLAITTITASYLAYQFGDNRNQNDEFDRVITEVKNIHKSFEEHRHTIIEKKTPSPTPHPSPTSPPPPPQLPEENSSSSSSTSTPPISSFPKPKKMGRGTVEDDFRELP